LISKEIQIFCFFESGKAVFNKFFPEKFIPTNPKTLINHSPTYLVTQSSNQPVIKYSNKLNDLNKHNEPTPNICASSEAGGENYMITFLNPADLVKNL